MTDETKELMKKARALLAAATPGRAEVIVDGDQHHVRIADGLARFCRIAVADNPDDADLFAFAVNNLPALLDALAAEKQRADEAEASAEAAKGAVDLLAKVGENAYAWPYGVAWACKEAHRLLTGGPPDGVYVRASTDKPRDLDAEVVAGVQASRTTPEPKP